MSRYIEIRKHFSPQLSKFLASITTASSFIRSGLHKTAHNSLFLRFTGSTNQIKPPLQVTGSCPSLFPAHHGQQEVSKKAFAVHPICPHFVFEIPDSPPCLHFLQHFPSWLYKSHARCCFVPL